MSPEFKHEEDSNEVYTPSFEHNVQSQIKNVSPSKIISQLMDVSAQKTAEPPHLKRRNKFKQMEEVPYMAQITINHDGQQVLHPLYAPHRSGYSMPPPIPISHRSSSEIMEEEEKEELAPIPYYPTCKCHTHYPQLNYNPHGYYYAPANLYYSGQSAEHESPVNKRQKKQRRKSKGEDSHHDCRDKRYRVKSAYINNRIPLHIVPTKVDNKMLLHAYPIKDADQAQKLGYEGFQARQGSKREDHYVKKLQYSADKVSVMQKFKSSEKKKKRKNRGQDRSMEVDDYNREFFKINKHDRKNTLSGHKRGLYESINNDSHAEYKPYKRQSVSNDSEIHLVNVKKDNPNSTMIKITNNVDTFLQNYASANSGDSSGSNKQERVSTDKNSSVLSSFNPPQKSSHVRFNSLVDIDKKFKKHKKLKLKSHNSKNSISGMRNVLGQLDPNISYGHNSSKFYENSLNQTQNILLNNSDPFKSSSEETPDLMRFTYDNLQGNQGLENKENIGLLGSDMSIEHKMGDVGDSIMYPSNTVFGIDKQE